MPEENRPTCPECGEPMTDDRDGMTGGWLCARDHPAVVLRQLERFDLPAAIRCCAECNSIISESAVEAGNCDICGERRRADEETVYVPENRQPDTGERLEELLDRWDGCEMSAEKKDAIRAYVSDLRARAEAAEAERDEWKRRAELVKEELEMEKLEMLDFGHRDR